MNHFQIHAFVKKLKQKKVMQNQKLSSLEKAIITAIGTIIGLALLGSMMSCTTSCVYRQGNSWKESTKKSVVTGWTYNK